jgi:hypothetical protein
MIKSNMAMTNGDEKRERNLVVKHLGKPRRRPEDNIKMDLKKVRWESLELYKT